MGIDSSGSVTEVGTLCSQKILRESSPISTSGKHCKPSIQVTDESERSEYRKMKESLESDDSMQNSSPGVAHDSRTPKRKLGALHRSGPILEEEHSSEQNGTGTSSSETKPTLPQHKLIQETEPLDISYSCTPASLQLKGLLISRLIEVTPLGRIQVVS
jgi:hypothetical protein